jgi:hypothetical protein
MLGLENSLIEGPELSDRGPAGAGQSLLGPGRAKRDRTERSEHTRRGGRGGPSNPKDFLHDSAGNNKPIFAQTSRGMNAPARATM